MTAQTSQFEQQLAGYRDGFRREVERAASGGYDRSADLLPAMAAADHIVELAERCGVERLVEILSALNAPRLAVRGEREGRPVVLKVESGEDRREALYLGVGNRQGVPVVKLVESYVVETPSGPMSLVVTSLTGNGMSLGRAHGSVETSFEDTKKMLRLAARIQLEPDASFEAVQSTALRQLHPAFTESMRLIRDAGMSPGYDVARAARLLLRDRSTMVPCHGDFNANNAVLPTPGEFRNLPDGEFAALDPRMVWGPRELSAAEAIAQSQKVGEECVELIAFACEADTAADPAALSGLVGLFHSMYGGYCIGNQAMYEKGLGGKPTRAPRELLESGHTLILSSRLGIGRDAA
jgi:hypothetical protein